MDDSPNVLSPELECPTNLARAPMEDALAFLMSLADSVENGLWAALVQEHGATWPMVGTKEHPLMPHGRIASMVGLLSELDEHGYDMVEDGPIEGARWRVTALKRLEEPRIPLTGIGYCPVSAIATVLVQVRARQRPVLVS